jgi:hypothetical protein
MIAAVIQRARETSERRQGHICQKSFSKPVKLKSSHLEPVLAVPFLRAQMERDVTRHRVGVWEVLC